MEGEDTAGEDEGPFLTLNVLVVAFLREVEAEEDGPEDGKGPDVGMEEERYGVV